MLVDLQVISLLLMYGISAFLLLTALPSALKILRHWNIQSTSDGQLTLERKHALISVLMQYAVFIQLLLLLFFLHLVNNHLPQVLEGAMCASGSLSVNAFGYPALYLKIVASVVYVVFLFLNYLDQSEVKFPFTPAKYVLFLVVMLIFSADLYVSLRYILAIEPDIIATCCSSNFGFNPGTDAFTQNTSAGIIVYVISFYVLSMLLMVGLGFARGRVIYILPILSMVFIFVDLTALKFHFVKFIYEMPSHNCLFDIFWAEYYYAGYLIFGSLAVHFLALLLAAVLQFTRALLSTNRAALARRLKWISAAALFFHVALLSVYWLKWIM